MLECTVRVEAGAPIAPHLTEGAVVCLAPGKHVGPVVIEHSLSLVGEEGAVIEGGGRGAVVHVVDHGLTITVKGLTLTDGYAETGSGLLLEGYSTVTVEDCVFVDNRDGQGGGQGLTARRGTLVVRRTRFAPREEVIVTNTATASFEDTVIEGQIAILDGATVSLRGGEVRGRMWLKGTTSRVPTVLVDGTKIATTDNDPVLTANLTVK